jgi:5'(3')-deoxyribonucleotidase
MKEFEKHAGYFAQAKKNHALLIKDVAAGVEKLKKEFIEKKMKPEAIKKLLVDQAKCAKDVSQSTMFLRNLAVEEGAKKRKIN